MGRVHETARLVIDRQWQTRHLVDMHFTLGMPLSLCSRSRWVCSNMSSVLLGQRVDSLIAKSVGVCMH